MPGASGILTAPLPREPPSQHQGRVLSLEDRYNGPSRVDSHGTEVDCNVYSSQGQLYPADPEPRLPGLLEVILRALLIDVRLETAVSGP